MHAAVDMNFIPLQIISKEVVGPPRHRRKKRDEETNTNNSQTAHSQTAQIQNNNRESLSNSKGHQFDLVEEAFPPLPG